jgi:hypothetical protein
MSFWFDQVKPHLYLDTRFKSESANIYGLVCKKERRNKKRENIQPFLSCHRPPSDFFHRHAQALSIGVPLPYLLPQPCFSLSSSPPAVRFSLLPLARPRPCLAPCCAPPSTSLHGRSSLQLASSPMERSFSAPSSPARTAPLVPAPARPPQHRSPVTAGPTVDSSPHPLPLKLVPMAPQPPTPTLVLPSTMAPRRRRSISGRACPVLLVAPMSLLPAPSLALICLPVVVSSSLCAHELLCLARHRSPAPYCARLFIVVTRSHDDLTTLALVLCLCRVPHVLCPRLRVEPVKPRPPLLDLIFALLVAVVTFGILACLPARRSISPCLLCVLATPSPLRSPRPLSHSVLKGKPNANHVRARIRNSRTQQLHNWTSSHIAQSK